MSSDWPVVRLGDLISLRGGLSYKSSLVGKGATILVGMGAVSYSEKFLLAGTKQYAGPFLQQHILKPEDLVIATRQQSDNLPILGFPALIPKSLANKEVVAATNLWKVINHSNVDNRFLFWLLRGVEYKSHIVSSSKGTTVKMITKDAVENYYFRCPPSNKRRQIVNILDDFESRIEVNKQINQTLEQMAQAMFKSWFVDFEPVKAKIAALEAGGSEEDALLAAMQAISGKDAAQLAQLKAEHADQYTELRTTAELFPSAMQDSDLGEVPKGWFWSTIGRDFDVIMGQSPPGDTYNESGEGMAFFQGRRDFGARFPTNRVFCTKPKRIAQKDDTLLSVRAPVGDVNIASQECCIGRGLAALRHISKCPTYTYYSISNLSSEFLSFDSEGTVFGSINQKNLKEINVISPPKQIINQFSRKLRSIDTLISINNDETLNLSKIRDTLLPRLLTGEIPLSESSQLEESIK